MPAPSVHPPALWRIMDANANRAVEGLRAVEEYARFQLEDQPLTAQYKQLRHDLVQLLALWEVAEHWDARDTAGDVGTKIAVATETRRRDLFDVAQANQKRAEQALRCLEEYGKVICGRTAARCERLRYRAYELASQLAHAQVVIGGRSAPIAKTPVTTAPATGGPEMLRARIRQARLYVLVGEQDDQRQFEALVRELVARGVHVLQLRAKQVDDRTLWQRAVALRTLTENTGTLMVVNDRPDIAVACGADGVHLGQDDLPPAVAREVLGAAPLIGVSTHDLEQVRHAVAAGADYLGCGPTFPSRTKAFADFPGPAFLRAVAETSPSLPCFAIGGVTAENLEEVQAAGFGRIAVSSAVTASPAPGESAAALLARLADDR